LYRFLKTPFMVMSHFNPKNRFTSNGFWVHKRTKNNSEKIHANFLSKEIIYELMVLLNVSAKDLQLFLFLQNSILVLENYKHFYIILFLFSQRVFDLVLYLIYQKSAIPTTSNNNNNYILFTATTTIYVHLYF
jgi:hypothetical protein